MDRSLRCRRLPAAAFRTGENRLTLRCRYHEQLPGLETIYLLGRFGVRGQTLTVLPDTLAIGDWCLQGLPNYAGNVSYCRTVRLDRTPERFELEFPAYRGVALQVAVNGGKPVTPWPPYRIDLAPQLQSGDNRIAITVLGHRRNSHGPFYLNEKWPVWTGPQQFKIYEHPERQQVPCGLLAAPVRLEY